MPRTFIIVQNTDCVTRSPPLRTSRRLRGESFEVSPRMWSSLGVDIVPDNVTAYCGLFMNVKHA